jgi:hypothetical protein
MKEAIKGVILDRGTGILDNKKVYKYLVAMVVVTDKPIDNIGNTQETIILSEKQSHSLTNYLSDARKYVPESSLGDLDQSILAVSNMSYDEIIVLPTL